MEKKQTRKYTIGFSRMEKKYEWKDHVIFMGLLLALAVWVNRGIEIKGLYMDDLYFWSCYGEQSFLEYVFPMGSTRFRFLYYLAAWLEMAVVQNHTGLFVPINILLNAALSWMLYGIGRRLADVYKRQRHGITDIIFAVGYKGSMVEEHFGDGSAYGFKAAYAYEETLLGTAGAIKNAGRLITEDRFFVLNADTFYQIDYTRLIRLQDEMNLDMALVLREVPDVSRYGQAVLDGAGRLTGFNEKTTEARPGTINGCLLYTSRCV